MSDSYVDRSNNKTRRASFWSLGDSISFQSQRMKFYSKLTSFPKLSQSMGAADNDLFPKLSAATFGTRFPKRQRKNRCCTICDYSGKYDNNRFFLVL